MPPFLNVPSSFLALPIVGSDTIVIFRKNNYTKPLVVTYSDLVAQIIASVPSGSGLITSVSDTADIDLSVAAGVLTALLTATGVTAGTYGDSTHVPQIVVDAKGRITSVTSVAISTGGTGTVTSVGATAGTGISVSVANPTTTPVLTITNTAPDQTVSLTASTGIAISGTYPNFTITNTSPSSGGGASLSYYLNGSVSQGIFGGVAFKQMSRTPVIGAGTDFTINSDGYIQSFITDANVPNQLLIPAGNWNFETYFSASSSGGSPSFYIELYKWNGTTLTFIASNSTTPEGITNGTSIDLYTSAVAVPQTTLGSTDRLAIRIYVTHSGRTITLHTEDNHLCQVITTFSTGITALNGLTDQVQSFATGTSGTDFGIVSSGSTHTFNLPTASASNRGALSSSDWTTFNNKGNGTVTSVAASVPSPSSPALSVAVTNPTTTPSISITANGNSSQVVLGNGSLGTIQQLAKASSIYIENQFYLPSGAASNTIEYVPSVDKLYVVASASAVVIYAVSTGELLATLGIGGATCIRYIQSINEVWITSTGAASIQRVSPTTNGSLGTITTSVTAGGFDILEYSSTKVFISCNNNPATVMVINPSTLAWVANVSGTFGSTNARGMALNTNPASAQYDKIVLVLAGGVAIINPATNAIATSSANPSSSLNAPYEIEYSQISDTYYVGSSGNNRAVILSVASSSTFTASIMHQQLACNKLLVDDTNNYLFVLNFRLSTLVIKMFNKTTLEPIVVSEQLTGTITLAGYAYIDVPNKRIFAIGNGSTAFAPIAILKYL